MEKPTLELMTEVMSKFILSQNKINSALHEKIAILEREIKEKEYQENIRKSETHEKTIDALMARVIHLEGRALEMERVAAIEEINKKILDKEFDSLDFTTMDV